MPKPNIHRASRRLKRAHYASLIVFFLLFFSCSISIAQVRFYTQVSQVQINEEESFQVQYIIEGAKKIEAFQTPSYSDFTLEESFDHPHAPAVHSKTLQVIDVYTRIAVLSPRKPGHFKIPGAVAVIDGIKMESNPINVTVTNEEFNQVAEPAVEDESEIAPGERIDQKIRENFFLTAHVSKQECYVGETLMAVYKAFSRLNANSHVSKRPSLTGFSVIEMVDSYDRNPTVEMFHGKAYNTHLIRKVQLFPLQPGNYELDGAEVEGMVHFTKKTGASQELERIFDPSTARDSVIPYQVNLKSESVTINVKPLPEDGQPTDFEGAVGNFTVTADCDKLKVEEGATVRVRFDVKGTGNFPLVTAPIVEWPSTVECSEPEIQEKTNPFVFPLSGSKSFIFSVSPTQTGSISIPPSIFSFFDPVSRIYKTVRTNPLNIEVIPRKSGMKSINSKSSENAGNAWRPEYYWFAIIVFAILGWILYQLLTARRKDGAEQVPVPAKTEVVEPGQGDLLFKTDASLANGDYKGFLNNLQQSLWDAAANKVDKHPSALNKQNLPVLLRRANLSSDFIHEYIDLLYACEWALYTPETSLHDMQLMRDRAALLFQKLNA